MSDEVKAQQPIQMVKHLLGDLSSIGQRRLYAAILEGIDHGLFMGLQPNDLSGILELLRKRPALPADHDAIAKQAQTLPSQSGEIEREHGCDAGDREKT